MKAVILAAGVASRMRPLTETTPKCLLKAGNKTILELTIENILANGIRDIIIVTGFFENKIRDFVKRNFPDIHVTFIYNPQYSSTNNIYSLWLAEEAVMGDDMLLTDSDIVFEKEIIGKLVLSGYENCLALSRHEMNEEEIKVKLSKDGYILEIGKEVNPRVAAGESVGIELFGKSSLPELYRILNHKINQEKNVNQFYESAFQELINTGRRIYAVDCSDHFCMEIDTVTDLETVNKLLIEKNIIK